MVNVYAKHIKRSQLPVERPWVVRWEHKILVGRITDFVNPMGRLTYPSGVPWVMGAPWDLKVHRLPHCYF